MGAETTLVLMEQPALKLGKKIFIANAGKVFMVDNALSIISSTGNGDFNILVEVAESDFPTKYYLPSNTKLLI